MDSESVPAKPLSRGIRPLILLVDALGLIILVAIAVQAVGQPGSLLPSLLNGGYSTQGVFALWFCLAFGVSAVIRDLLGVDPFVQRDPESGNPRLSLRRAARELPGFWFFVVSFLVGAWGYGAFSLATTMTRSPESALSLALAVAMSLGVLSIFAWITWIALRRIPSR